VEDKIDPKRKFKGAKQRGDIEKDTIDLGKYVIVLFRQWQLIALAAVVCALAAGLGTLLLQPTYTATAVVATTKTTSDVSFGSAIQTLSEDQLLANAQPGSNIAAMLVDRKARIQSFVQLVNNAAVAQVVLEKVGNQLPETERTVSALLNMVEGSLVDKADSIEINVTYRDPELAAAIANAWGDAYVRQINSVYGGSGPGESLLLLNPETAKAKDAYDTAQAALLAFITQNKMDELRLEIGQKQTIITSLSDARNTAVNTIITEAVGKDQQVIKEMFSAQAKNELAALQSDLNTRQELFNTYVKTLLDLRQAALSEQVKDITTEWSRAWSDRQRARQLLDTATAMREEVRRGGAPAAARNVLALTLFKGQVYVPAGTGSVTLWQLPDSWANSVAAVKPETMITELDALIGSLKLRITDLDAKIAKLSDTLLKNQGLDFLNVPLSDETSQLAKAIEARYPELFQSGALTALSLKVVAQGNPLETEAITRSQALLNLQGLDQVLNFNVVDTPMTKKIQALQQEVRDLQAKVTRLADQQDELTRARDLAYTTYKTLATKQAELGIAAQTTSIEVALAAPASVPTKGGSTLKNVAVAGVIGLFLGILFAYGLEFWWGYNGQPSRPVTVLGILRRSGPQKKRQSGGDGASTPPALPLENVAGNGKRRRSRRDRSPAKPGAVAPLADATSPGSGKRSK
jgi:uncharacterized protein involved in exopolysaccharide biosynthesis